MDDAWPYKGKTDYLFPQDHGYQYRGYVLDKEKRPTFRYHYGKIVVEDFFEDLIGKEGQAFFRRTMSFVTEVPQESFYFRVGTAPEITSDGGAWKVGRLNLRVPANTKATVREGDPEELLLEITLPVGRTVLTLDYQW